MADVEGVAAGDGHLLGHRDPPGLALQQGAHRQVVVGAEQAVEIGEARHGWASSSPQGEAGGLLVSRCWPVRPEIGHRLVVAFHPQLGAHVEPGAEVESPCAVPGAASLLPWPGGGPVIHAYHHVDGGESESMVSTTGNAGGGDHLRVRSGVLGVRGGMSPSTL